MPEIFEASDSTIIKSLLIVECILAYFGYIVIYGLFDVFLEDYLRVYSIILGFIAFGVSLYLVISAVKDHLIGVSLYSFISLAVYGSSILFSFLKLDTETYDYFFTFVLLPWGVFIGGILGILCFWDRPVSFLHQKHTESHQHSIINLVIIFFLQVVVFICPFIAMVVYLFGGILIIIYIAVMLGFDNNIFTAIVCLIIGYIVSEITATIIFIFRDKLNNKLLLLRGSHHHLHPFLVFRSYSKTDHQLELTNKNTDFTLPFLYHITGEKQRFAIYDNILSHLSRSVSRMGQMILIRGRLRNIRKTEALIVSSTPRQWRYLVERIGAHSLSLFLIPELSPGLLEEVAMISDKGWWEKCIVIMMPESTATKAKYKINRLQRWCDIKEGLISKGYFLPPYDEKGMLYLPNKDLSIRKAITLNGIFKWKNLEQAILQIVPYIPHIEPPPKFFYTKLISGYK